MMNEEFAKQEWDKASDTLSHLKATQSKLDFKKHCLDFSEGKISVDYFVLLVAWTWNKLAMLNGLSGLTHWAIWRCCEDFPLSDDDEYPDFYPRNIDELKEAVKLAVNDDYRAIWQNIGLTDEEIDNLIPKN